MITKRHLALFLDFAVHRWPDQVQPLRRISMRVQGRTRPPWGFANASPALSSHLARRPRTKCPMCENGSEAALRLPKMYDHTQPEATFEFSRATTADSVCCHRTANHRFLSRIEHRCKEITQTKVPCTGHQSSSVSPLPLQCGHAPGSPDPPPHLSHLNPMNVRAWSLRLKSS